MARKKKVEKSYYTIVEWECRRCGFVEKLMQVEGYKLTLTGKVCPMCHTHLPCGQVKHIEE